MLCMAASRAKWKTEYSMVGSDNGDGLRGTPEERAVARAILQERQVLNLSQADQDALLLYCAQWKSSELTGTPVWQRGSELRSAMFPVIPYHLDPRAQRATCASLEFQFIFQREPTPGDVLCYRDVKLAWQPDLPVAKEFIAAWGRQLPKVRCPVKIEGGQIYQLTPRTLQDPTEEWIQERDDSEDNWRRVEECAVGLWSLPLEPGKAHLQEFRRLRTELEKLHPIPAVTFLGVIHGEHRCRPATEEEFRKAMDEGPPIPEWK